MLATDARRGTTSDLIVTYRIDGDGVIVDTGGGWTDFALQGDAPELLPDQVLGRPLLSFVSDPTTRVLYLALTERVHDQGTTARFPYRCDAPDTRRWMVMEMTPLDRGGTQYRTWVEGREARTPMPVAGGGEGPLVRMCGWCKRVHDDGAWIEVEEAVTRPPWSEFALRLRDDSPSITHGMCEECEYRIEAVIGSLSAG